MNISQAKLNDQNFKISWIEHAADVILKPTTSDRMPQQYKSIFLRF